MTDSYSSESREQREKNLRALGRFFKRANTVWVAVVFVFIPWIFPGTEPVRFYGLCGLVMGNGLRWWYFRVIGWSDRTGRDWDGSYLFLGATAIAALATTAFVYASISVYEHALDDWRQMFSFLGQQTDRRVCNRGVDVMRLVIVDDSNYPLPAR